MSCWTTWGPSLPQSQRGCTQIEKQGVDGVRRAAGVTVKSYNIIYELLDDMRAAMEGRLAPSEERVPLGKAEVRAVFGKGSKLVAGCMVTDGQLRSESFITVSGAKAIVGVLLWHAHGVVCQGLGPGKVVLQCTVLQLWHISSLCSQAATLPRAGVW